MSVLTNVSRDLMAEISALTGTNPAIHGNSNGSDDDGTSQWTSRNEDNIQLMG